MKNVLIAGMPQEKAGLLSQWIKEELPDYTQHIYTDYIKAFSTAVDCPMDLVLLGTGEHVISGIEMGKWLRKLYPSSMYLVYCADDENDAYQAIRQARCNGYLLWPVTEEDIQKEVKHCLSKSVIRADEPKEEKLRVRCFGNFEVFYQEKPLPFQSKKSKELFAYLVDRCGGICTNAEMMAALWEDDSDHISYLKKIKNDLLVSLRECDLDNILIVKRGGLAIDANSFDCDYYNWRQGKKKGQNNYLGEYMEQYSWAEKTKGLIEM